MKTKNSQTILLTVASNRGIGFWTSICLGFSNFFGFKSYRYNLKLNAILKEITEKLEEKMENYPDYDFSDFRIVKENKLCYIGSVYGVLKPGREVVETEPEEELDEVETEIEETQPEPQPEPESVKVAEEVMPKKVSNDIIEKGNFVVFTSAFSYKDENGKSKNVKKGVYGEVVGRDSLGDYFDIECVTLQHETYIIKNVPKEYLRKLN